MDDNNPTNDTQQSTDKAQQAPLGVDYRLRETLLLEAAAGWQWIASGWDLFVKSPGLWIGMILVSGIISMVAGIIPFASSILMPLFSAGFMYACYRLETGQEMKFENLFHGFQNQAGPLAILGLLNVAASVVIGFVVLTIIGTGTGLGALGGEEGAIAGFIFGLLASMLFGALLYIPVAMGLWFAPALVLFHPELKPIDAVVLSFKACLKNWVAFLIYSIALLVIITVASIPFFLGLLIAMPVIVASTFAGYRSIFTEK